jgi:Ras-related protein Rab-1A
MNARDIDYDYLFKIIIIGNTGIGKSTLLCRFADDKFYDNFVSTIGVDFKIKTILVNDKVIKLQIWDTAGQERFRTITTSYYRSSHIIFLCYDTTDKQSFDDLDLWKNEINKYSNNNVKVVLCATKTDLENARKISYKEGLDYAKKNNYDFYETSSQSNINIDALFIKTSEKLLNEFMTNLTLQETKKYITNNTITIKPQKINLIKKCC